MKPQPSIARPEESPDYFSNCTHCGFCLAVCPTYKLTGDENNSPRGRLRLWSEEAAGRLPRDPWTDHYTSECVGCLACEPACPATVPYGEIFERNVGVNTPLKIARGKNALWKDGGLQYAPPIR